MFRKIGEILLQILYTNVSNEFYRDLLENIDYHVGVVIDLGGGTGAVIQALIDEGKVLPQNSVVIDPHIGLHKIGVRKNINVSRIVSVAEHLPIREIVKGGRIYIYDYDLTSFSTKLLRVIEKLMGFPGNFFKIHDLLNVFSKLKCRGRIAKYSHGEFLMTMSKG